ncbi:hypothetical protein [uncultured Roseivirga sp.]|uniref:hypothetical protein n=1 Tax=uncultured Roseivirga sp. TaxID=543088 RepID=UPI000D7A7974|nr:hypothetical protein [uncultured Roseivirga sp.]PWL30743.1 MAG: hypothetical protein DCO95_04500 [Roseivirga sp. XM-24bin3]
MDVVGVCIAIIAAILGAGYPILLQVTSRLNEKYKSEVVVTLFDKEPIKNRFVNSLFFIALPSVGIYYLAGLVLPEIHSICGNYLLIEKIIAGLLVIATTNLIIQFYHYIRLCMTYYRPEELVKHIKDRHVF